jgi:PHD/YefM family antitoxin component YafN of YafNO toxin-antitoxin module
VPIADYESLLETLEIHADAETMRNLTSALDDERRGRLFKRDKIGKWVKCRKSGRVA